MASGGPVKPGGNRWMRPEFAPGTAPAVKITLLSKQEFAGWRSAAGEVDRRWADANGFSAEPAEILGIPDGSGGMAEVLAGGPGQDPGRDERFHLASVLRKLPAGNYFLANRLGPEDRDEAALASLLAQYQPAARRTGSGDRALLVAPEGTDRERLGAIAAGEFLVRDMINAPASEMTPSRLEEAFRCLAGENSADLSVTKGADLADQCPMTHAVGRSSEHRPRLLELTWGASGPLVTLVGKGVCFDTGGLNVKPGQAMALMKKDMAGAAVVAGLCSAIMEMKLPIRIRALIPVAENSISGRAFRPGDVLTSKSGVSVEITNTDAEGRLLLADALTLAERGNPDLLLTFGTLTGAARIALGPEIVPFYSDSDCLAGTLAEAGGRVRDPLWRMPLWQPYRCMLDSEVADMSNSPGTAFAGSISAALFLHRFVQRPDRFVHFDIYGWQASAAPGRPKGGVGQAGRAVLEAIPGMLP